MPCCRCAENATSCRPNSRRVSAVSPARNLRNTSSTRYAALDVLETQVDRDARRQSSCRDVAPVPHRRHARCRDPRPPSRRTYGAK
eukprot:4025198-Prymnesium_polylepis.2